MVEGALDVCLKVTMHLGGPLQLKFALVFGKRGDEIVWDQLTHAFEILFDARDVGSIHVFIPFFRKYSRRFFQS